MIATSNMSIFKYIKKIVSWKHDGYKYNFKSLSQRHRHKKDIKTLAIKLYNKDYERE